MKSQKFMILTSYMNRFHCLNLLDILNILF